MKETEYRKSSAVYEPKIETFEQGRLLVSVIGIDEYQNWQTLKNAVNDAVGFQQTLISKLGFTALVKPLRNEFATKAAITSLIEDELPKLLEKDDNLILFFAGHGHTRVDEVGSRKVETGYLIPVEASSSDKYSEYIEIESFLKSVGRLPAKHILVILDSCHSGIALGETTQYRDAVSYIKDLSNKVSRRVITSARREQPALDGGPISGHSLFTGTLINGFGLGVADTDGNGLITSSELGLFVRQKVGQASESKQTPDFGAFAFDDRGEMVIPLRDQSLKSLKNRAFSALQRGENAHLREIIEQINALNADDPTNLYMQYKLSMIESDIDRAEKYISALQINVSSTPLNIRECIGIEESLRAYKSLLKIRERKFSVDIEVISKEADNEFVSVKSQKLGDLNGYLVKDRSEIGFLVKNREKNPVYVYMFLMNSSGIIENYRLSRHYHDYDPFRVEGGKDTVSQFFELFIDKPEYFPLYGLDQIHFFISSNQLNFLEHAPSFSSRAPSPPAEYYAEEIKNKNKNIDAVVLNVFIESGLSLNSNSVISASEVLDMPFYTEIVILTQQAQQAIADRNYNSALAAYGQSLKLAQSLNRPQLIAVLFDRRGKALETTGDVQQAIIAYESALQSLAPEASDEVDEMISRLSRVGKSFYISPEPIPDLYSPQAAESLAAAEADPALEIKLWLSVGNAYFRQPQEKPALNAYQEMLACDQIDNWLRVLFKSDAKF